jgi:hypothetical protein
VRTLGFESKGCEVDRREFTIYRKEQTDSLRDLPQNPVFWPLKGAKHILRSTEPELSESTFR